MLQRETLLQIEFVHASAQSIVSFPWMHAKLLHRWTLSLACSPRGTVGKRLDFLMQELNREANTLGSKSVDIETTRASVEMKVLIEQMREQIQNIE